MLFIDILKRLESPIKSDFLRLIDTAFKNQQDAGDLLLWLNNGSYDESVLGWKHPEPGQTYSPYVIGTQDIGQSEDTHYRFIHQYRSVYVKDSHSDYLKKLEYPEGKYSEEHRKKVDEMHNLEETTINLEMLIYLKFWESDSIIKKLYELVRLANGESYDWHFRFPKTLKDNASKESRENVIREKIRNRLDAFPALQTAINESYKTQIRNAIAHSTYAIQGRYIHLHNYFAGDPYSDIKALTFDQWIERFHKTSILHNCYIEAVNLVNKWYANMTIQNKFQVRVVYKDGRVFYRTMIYRPEWQDWR